MKKGYSTFAIIVLNMMLIFIVLNLLAWGGIHAWKADCPPHWPTSSLSDLQAVYPGMSQADIATLLDETWERPFRYKSFVGFKERPRSGKFVNVSKQGFRYTHVKDLGLDSTGINIYVFGGSTTFGYGVDDESTIPAHLQRIFSDLYPDKSINVFNFGSAYYYSTQELILLLDLIRNGHLPSVAIFIDGLNEGQERPYFSQEMRKLFRAHNYDKLEQFAITVSKLPLFSAFEFVLNKGYEESLEEFMDPAEIRNNYLANKKIIRELSASYNFKSYFFIQPIPGYRNEFGTHAFMPEDVSMVQINNELSKISLLDKTVDNKTSFSLTHLLEGYQKQPFVDACHYTSEVCRLIAEHVADKIQIPQRGGPPEIQGMESERLTRETL